MEERGLKTVRKKTEYLCYNGHQYVEMHLQGETVKTVKTLKYKIWDRHWRRIDNWMQMSPTECRACGITGK